jgi:hypothetical protein
VVWPGSPGGGDVRPGGPLPVPLRRHPVLLAAKEHREEGTAKQERAEADRAGSVTRRKATPKAPPMARAASQLLSTLLTSFGGWPPGRA